MTWQWDSSSGALLPELWSWLLLLICDFSPFLAPYFFLFFFPEQAIEKKVDEVVEEAVEFADESPLPRQETAPRECVRGPQGLWDRASTGGTGARTRPSLRARPLCKKEILTTLMGHERFNLCVHATLDLKG